MGLALIWNDSPICSTSDFSMSLWVLFIATFAQSRLAGAEISEMRANFRGFSYGLSSNLRTFPFHHRFFYSANFVRSSSTFFLSFCSSSPSHRRWERSRKQQRRVSIKLSSTMVRFIFKNQQRNLISWIALSNLKLLHIIGSLKNLMDIVQNNPSTRWNYRTACDWEWTVSWIYRRHSGEASRPDHAYWWAHTGKYLYERKGGVP